MVDDKRTVPVKSEQKARQPPVKIPLPFEDAVGGLLDVDPAKIKSAKAKKKPAKRKK